jgi:hypothetical protein
MLTRLATCTVTLLLLLIGPAAAQAQATAAKAPAAPAKAQATPAKAPAAAEAQDATAVLDQLRQAVAKQMPLTVRLTARGSGYTVANGDKASPQHFKIDNYTQQLDLGANTVSEQTTAGDKHTTGSAPYLFWTSPYGFLTGAAKYNATLGTETLWGTKYQVLTFTTGGQQIRGYINDKHELERTRTEFQDPARGKVAFEAIYRDWTDFKGVKAPTMIIEKENDQPTRILVVSQVDTAAARSTN